MKRFNLLLAVFLFPTLIHAADCKDVLAKLPDHSGDQTPYAVQVNNFMDECKKRPNGNDPKVYNQCMLSGLTAMVTYGNYIASEKLAVAYCNAGNQELSKNMMRSIMMNANAPAEDKAVGAELINN
jgi:hypothetical protein